jgi:hypothetical protein
LTQTTAEKLQMTLDSMDAEYWRNLMNRQSSLIQAATDFTCRFNKNIAALSAKELEICETRCRGYQRILSCSQKTDVSAEIENAKAALLKLEEEKNAHLAALAILLAEAKKLLEMSYKLPDNY